MKKNNKIFIIFSILLIIVFIKSSLAIDTDSKSNDTEVIFLNVGQGDATLIQKQNIQILIDGGKGRVVLDELGKFMPFGDRKLEMLILTHPDEDHMGGLLEVMKSYEVLEVMETGVACEKDICTEWNELIDKNNISVNYADFGELIQMEGIELSVLYPLQSLKGVKLEELNDSSLVLKMNTGEKTYIFVGDAGKLIEETLLINNINLKADVLKIGHHGSKNSTSIDFLEAVSPQTAIISVGKNSYGHPAEEVLNRLKNINANVLRTDESGSISF